MHENWSLMQWNFNQDEISYQWAPIHKDSSYIFDFIDIISVESFLNGSYFYLNNGNLISYGGSGYGAFEYYDFFPSGDSVILVKSYCIGHCGDEPPSYSAHFYDKNNLLIKTLFYGQVKIEAEDWIEFSQFLKFEDSKDSVFYSYDSYGRLKKSTDNTLDFPMLYHLSDAYNIEITDEFYQVYIGNIEMNMYFKKEIGYCPKIILIEISRGIPLQNLSTIIPPENTSVINISPMSKPYIKTAEL